MTGAAAATAVAAVGAGAGAAARVGTLVCGAAKGPAASIGAAAAAWGSLGRPAEGMGAWLSTEPVLLAARLGAAAGAGIGALTALPAAVGPLRNGVGIEGPGPGRGCAGGRLGVAVGGCRYRLAAGAVARGGAAAGVALGAAGSTAVGAWLRVGKMGDGARAAAGVGNWLRDGAAALANRLQHSDDESKKGGKSSRQLAFARHDEC